MLKVQLNNKQFIDQVRILLNAAEREELTSYFDKNVLVKSIIEVMKDYIPKLKGIY